MIRHKMEDLSRYSTIVVDTETTGLNTWDGDRPIGTALGLVRDDGTVDCRYYPYGHHHGPQYGRGEVNAFLRRELRGKHLIFHNSVFDLMMLLADGVDVRENTLHDTMFAGILVDPNDQYSLDYMVRKYVDPNLQKIRLPFDKDNMAAAPIDQVGPYAEQDVRLTWLLHQSIQAHIQKKKLEQIYRIECDCAAVTVEMMSNGLYVDTRKLEQFLDGAHRDVQALERRLGKINPNSGKQLQDEFQKLGLAHPWNFKCPPCSEKMRRVVQWPGFEPQLCPYCHQPGEKGTPHFGKKLLAHIDHPLPKLVNELKTMKRLRDAFLKPWSESLKGSILPFELNQLRDRDFSGATKGTVTGRYSAGMLYGGAQPQQIWKPSRQIEEVGDRYILRELFIAEDGEVMDTDAAQEEFRLLVHYSNSKRLLQEYVRDPYKDYHNLVAQDILKGKLSRGKVKTVNFGKIYGMGRSKFAQTMDIPLTEAVEMYAIYEREFPEVKDTANRYDRKARVTGEIRTLRGRLFEFGPTDKSYIALSRLIQGSAGDVMKEALVKVYRANLMDKMRLTVHDEILGDGSREKGPQLIELLNDVKGLNVPMKWELNCGRSWAMNDDTVAKFL